MAVGLGYLRVAAILTVTILVVQFLARYAARLVNRYDRRSDLPQRYEIAVYGDSAALSAIDGVWSAFAETRQLTPVQRSISRRLDGVEWHTEFTCADLRMSDLTPLEHRLLGVHGVTRVAMRHEAAEDENQEQ